MIKKVLIHVCCADCLLKFIQSIKENNKDVVEIVAYFYNPNIQPRSEYLARLKAVQKVAEENKIKVVVPDWSPKEWFLSLQNNVFGERWRERPSRCINCWNLRLRRLFEWAKKNEFNLVSSTLITSHYQDKNIIKKIGITLEKEFEIKFLIPKKVIRELKTKGFYKQNYCGCCYSLVEGLTEKFSGKRRSNKSALSQ